MYAHISNKHNQRTTKTNNNITHDNQTVEATSTSGTARLPTC